MAAKVTKKELKEPDFLQVAYQKTIIFIIQHQTKMYGILALILFGVAIALGWHLYRLNYNKSATALYNQLEDITLNKSPNSTDKLIEGYKNVTAKYPDSQAALYASYKLGNLYLTTNKIDLSLKAYDEFLMKASEKDGFKIFAESGKGYCYEAKKDYKNALASFERTLKMTGAKMFEGQIYRDIGRIYEEMVDRKKSLENYRKSLEKTNDPTMEMLLKRKIAELS
ncbi:MAG: tetratricopeptide repeat protein [Syntrophales bacterium LBB04]|nr:tetratricopeptide repeat protein [Syntrophales bacterium LBB04]